MYFRHNPNVCFLLPAIACGIDLDQRPFIEVAWLFWAVGLGSE
jgi:hypothetical protein